MKFHAPRSKQALSVTIGCLAAIGTFAAVALGSAGGGGFAPEPPFVTASSLNKLDLKNDGVRLETRGPVDLRVQKIVIGPGGYSGWHHHPGLVIASVASGAVTFTSASDCTATTYGPGLPDGTVFAEDSKTAGQASSVTGATIYVTYIVPHAVPGLFRIEDIVPPPCTPNSDGDHGDGGDHHQNGSQH